MRINVKEVRKRLHGYFGAIWTTTSTMSLHVAFSATPLPSEQPRTRWDAGHRRLLHGRHLAAIISTLELALVAIAPFLLIAEVVRE